MRRVAAGIIGLGMGCGALGAHAPPAPPSDGLGPFALPTALEICDGSVRWVAAGGSAAGFCVPTTTAPAACTTARECGAREQCVCGRCTVPVCALDVDCARGESCQIASGRCGHTCASTSDCPSGADCQVGICTPRCATNADCAHGEHCDTLGVCIALPCTEDAACGDERCDTQQSVTSLREPSVVAMGDPFPVALYLEVGGQSVWRAVSSDGSHFTVSPTHPVLSMPGVRVGAPSVTRTPSGTWVLAAAQGSDAAIVLAASTDGVSFMPPVVALTPVEAWEGGAVGSPGIAWFSQTLALSYTGQQGVGLATVQIMRDDTIVVTRVRDPRSGTARVLDPARVTDPVFWRDVDAVQGPDLVPFGGTLRMYFSAHGADSSASVSGGMLQDPPIHWSVGVASASAGSWEFAVSPFDPILTRTESLGDTRDTLEPAAIDLSGSWSLLVRGETLSGTDEGIFGTPP